MRCNTEAMKEQQMDPANHFARDLKTKIVVLNGPSGTGKSTILKAIMAMPEFAGKFGFSVSHTTRGPRPGEVEGREYYFVSKEEFFALKEQSGFLETVETYTNFYGTSLMAVGRVLETQNCILDIDYKGSLLVKQSLPSYVPALYVFVRPPSFASMETRLRSRGTESPEQLEMRLKTAHEELQFFETHKEFYDVHLTNDNLEQCVSQFAAALSRFLAH